MNQNQSSTKNIWATINEEDLFCPILLARYDEKNYPVALMCGHLISITAFQALNNKKCPMCSQQFPQGFNPQKLLFVESLIKEIYGKKTMYCEYHPSTEAIGRCTEDHVDLCANCCFSSSLHAGHKKQALEKFSCSKNDGKSSSSRKNQKEQEKQGLEQCREKLHGDLKLVSADDRMYGAYNKYSTPNYECRICKTTRSRESWHCNICEYDVCLSCRPFKAIEPPKCKHGELKLVFGLERMRKKLNPYTSLRFKCNRCRVIKEEASWHCELCSWDVCLECHSGKASSGLACEVASHGDLTLVCAGDRRNGKKKQYDNFEFTCGVCDNVKKENSWHCNKCEFDVCLACMPVSERLDCGKKEHKSLKLVSGEERDKENGKFLCNKCERMNMGRSWNCKECKFNVCISCHPIALGTTHSCRNLDHGDLKVRQIEEIGYFCNICRITNIEESWTCDKCDFDVCLKCRPKVV